MAQLGFYFDQTRCIGCYTCSVACKDWHDIEAGAGSFIRVQTIESGQFPDLSLAFLAVPCYQCDEPACAQVCPAGAIRKRSADGVVLIDPEKCLGRDECEKTPCVTACRYKATQFGLEENAKAHKCDLCQERWPIGRKPICVEACPMFALDAGPLTALQEEYGEETTAVGFSYSKKLKPGIVFKPKVNKLDLRA